MNKKLVALAVAGVLAAPLAQAQTANVTLYGRVNLDVEVIINAKQDNSTASQEIKGTYYRMSSNSSRLGVRGTESLGGGLSVIFQVEERYNADNSGPATVTGDTFLGLRGGWGTLKFGYFLTPYDDLTAIWSSTPTLGTTILNAANIWANNGGQSISTGSFDDRIGNSIRYDTPTMSGFTGSFQLGGRDNGPTTASGDLNEMRRHAYVVSVGGFYNNGPIQAGVVYEQHNAIRADAIAPIEKLTDQGISAGFSYNFGVVKVGVAYEGLKYDVASGGDVKRNFWAVSGIWNIGPGQLYTMYGRGQDGTGSALDGSRVGAVTKGDQTSANTWQISYTYPLSKRTLIYGGYVMLDNDKNANYNLGTNGPPGLCGGNGAPCGDAARPQGLLLGAVHFF
jgi:predicted porin